MDFQVGDKFFGIQVETFVEPRISRPRVRPVEVLPRELKINFPTQLRRDHPIGTKFRCNLTVCQKSDGAGTYGNIYLQADFKTITFSESSRSRPLMWAILKPESISKRAYEYFTEASFQKEVEDEFLELRKELLDLDRKTSLSQSERISRDQKIVDYALMRSEGVCEGCEKPAPFLKRNGDPYLEVHHIKPVANGGRDVPINVAALCPNCHARVTHGNDAQAYNRSIQEKVRDIELQIG